MAILASKAFRVISLLAFSLLSSSVMIIGSTSIVCNLVNCTVYLTHMGVQTILPKEPNYMGTKNSSIQNVYKNFGPRSQIWLRSHRSGQPYCTVYTKAHSVHRNTEEGDVPPNPLVDWGQERTVHRGRWGTRPFKALGGGGTGRGAPPLECLLMLIHFIFISLM